MRKSLLYFITILSFFAFSCKEKQVKESTTAASSSTGLEKKSYGTTTDGQAVDLYTMTNKNGMVIEVITYGGIITKLTSPDKDGKYSNIVLGYDSLSQYQKETPYFGALIGRYGNRIAKGKFTLDGKEYTLETNNSPNALHGGTKGFDKVVWKIISATKDENGSVIKLNYLSKDMDMGYPGNLNTIVTYTLDNNDALTVDYEATTDKKTIVNLTQHSYFNLSGDFKNTILDHEVTLPADKYLPVDAGLIPTGKLADVKGTPFDFTTPKTIGKDINAKDDQLTKGKGYDHCWVINGSGLRNVATVFHPNTGRIMEMQSDEPAMQFYTGNFLDSTLPMPGGGTYAFRSGFCLETQHYPDSPNQKQFPSTELEPGKIYKSKTIFKFSKK